jgi:RNA polymerase sigma-70 factor (ECF subfamily)
MNEPEEVSTDEDLVKAALSGEDEAFTELVRRHKRRVFSMVSRFVRSKYELEDVCQEVFIKAYNNLGRYRAEAPFGHWLAKIAVNTCYDTLRKRRRGADEVPLESVEYALTDPTAGEKAAAHEAWKTLSGALVRLKPEDRLVVTLLHLEEMSVAEVAELTGWSAAKVKVRAFRARKELKRILEEIDEN